MQASVWPLTSFPPPHHVGLLHHCRYLAFHWNCYRVFVIWYFPYHFDKRVVSLLTHLLRSRTILCCFRCACTYSKQTQGWWHKYRYLSTFRSFYPMHHILRHRYSADTVHCEYIVSISFFIVCFLSDLLNKPGRCFLFLATF